MKKVANCYSSRSQISFGNALSREVPLRNQGHTQEYIKRTDTKKGNGISREITFPSATLVITHIFPFRIWYLDADGCIQNPNGIPYHSPGLRYPATLGK